MPQTKADSTVLGVKFVLPFRASTLRSKKFLKWKLAGLSLIMNNKTIRTQPTMRYLPGWSLLRKIFFTFGIQMGEKQGILSQRGRREVWNDKNKWWIEMAESELFSSARKKNPCWTYKPRRWMEINLVEGPFSTRYFQPQKYFQPSMSHSLNLGFRSSSSCDPIHR